MAAQAATEVTRPHTDYTYDGRKRVCLPLEETVTCSWLAAAWLGQSQLTKPAQFFVDHCRNVLTPGINA